MEQLLVCGVCRCVDSLEGNRMEKYNKYIILDTVKVKF